MLAQVPTPILGAVTGAYRAVSGYEVQKKTNGESFDWWKFIKTVLDGGIIGFLWGLVLKSPTEVIGMTYLGRVGKEELIKYFKAK